MAEAPPWHSLPLRSSAAPPRSFAIPRFARARALLPPVLAAGIAGAEYRATTRPRNLVRRRPGRPAIATRNQDAVGVVWRACASGCGRACMGGG